MATYHLAFSWVTYHRIYTDLPILLQYIGEATVRSCDRVAKLHRLLQIRNFISIFQNILLMDNAGTAWSIVIDKAFRYFGRQEFCCPRKSVAPPHYPLWYCIPWNSLIKALLSSYKGYVTRNAQVHAGFHTNFCVMVLVTWHFCCSVYSIIPWDQIHSPWGLSLSRPLNTRKDRNVTPTPAPG